VAKKRLRIANTATDVLIGNLRGEVGEVVTTWVLLRHFMSQASKLKSDDVQREFSNKELAFLWLLTDKLHDELVARLSELSDQKVGRTNFYFASRKLRQFEEDVRAFTKYVIAKKLRQKRNQEIAHREQPEKWFEDRQISIPYRTLVKATARALRLMKLVDRPVLGPSAPFLWCQARKKRYELEGPPRAVYMLVPYFHLSAEDRIRIVEAEQLEGRVVWSEMETTVNGQASRVLACKEWGILLLGNRYFPLPQYPLQKLESINFDEDRNSGITAGDASPDV